MTSGAGAPTVPRFDWFLDTEGTPYQLLVLFQLCYPDKETGDPKSIYLFIAAQAEVEKKKLYPSIKGKRYVITY